MATEVPDDLMDLVAKEIEVTRLSLVSINPETRNDGIALINRLLLEHTGDTSDAFQLNDYLMIWRGLINFMWKSDELLPQGSAMEKISYLIHSCTSYQGKILFLNALFMTIKDECLSTTQHHIDKCMILVRRCLRQFLFTFFICDWNFENMIKLSEVLYTAFESFTLSLRIRLQDIFLEELAKVSRGIMPNESLVIILDSFLSYNSELNDFMLRREVTQNVFINLLSLPFEVKKMLGAKFQARRKIGKPGKSYNDLKMTCIEFNPQDVVKVLNKYVTEVDFTRKCSLELTKSIKCYSCLRDSIQPCKPKDLKLNSQVLKQRKKKYVSKMVYEGVKQLEIIDSKSKKNGRAVNVHKSLKEFNKMGEIVEERGKIGKFMWKVRKFNNANTLNKDFNLHRSWKVSKETKNNSTNTVCMNDDEPPLQVPAGFKVEVLETPEKAPTKMSKKFSTPRIKSIKVGSSLKESKSIKLKRKSIILKINDRSNKKNINKQNSPIIKIGTPKVSNAIHNSWSVSTDYGGSALKKAPLLVPAGFKVEVLETPEKAPTKISKKFSTSNSKSITIDSTPKESNSNKHICKRINLKINYGSNMKNINKQNSLYIKIGIPNALNKSHTNSWSVSVDNGKSTSKRSPLLVPAGFKVEGLETPQKTTTKVQKNVSTPNGNHSIDSKSNKFCNILKRISLTSIITPEKSFKSPKSSESPNFEHKVLRRRTIIISKKIPDGQNEGTPKRKMHETSATKVVQKRRKIIAKEEISMSKPKEILIKAHEKVRNEVYENGFGSLRRSPRLSIKHDFCQC